MSQKIRIKLKSYDHNLVDKSADKIVKTVKVQVLCNWTNSIANTQKTIHCIAFSSRQ